MCCNQHRFRSHASMFRLAKSGADGIRSGFLSRVTKKGRRGSGGGNGEKVDEFVVIGPLGTGPLQVLRSDCDGDGIIVTARAGRDV